MTLLTVGTEIFNHGDMANHPHFGEIVEVSTKLTPQYKIRAPHGEYWVMAMGFSPKYEGNGMTRLVTKQAYMEYKETAAKRIKEMLANKK